ncbi:hypothetical protein E24_00196 [Faustovirus]|nr:hypothetical protein PRJ_Fausto_00180 [Faustovirus]AMN83127.1 hypothetical protein E24_00196 [Faustovirus]AMN84107.1 hypothetical protein D5a_00194 [Faustovirus]AMN85096.1 hypothetical protein E23_00195 [Faustovirus]QBR99093.1 hypothetical protein [Faustovirus mariensis]
MSDELVYSEKDAIVTDMTYIVEGGRDLDSSDEYWDNWKRELDAERAKDPQGHKMFVMNSWLRKHPGMSHNDYADYLREHGTTESMPNEYIEQPNDQNKPWVRPTNNTVPEWQRKLANAPGVPVEYWNLEEDELKAAMEKHVAFKAELTPTAKPNNVQLPIASPYEHRRNTPEDQEKRAKWLEAWKAQKPLTEEQLIMPEAPEVNEAPKVQLTASEQPATVDPSNQTDAEFIKSTNITIKNIIGCLHELKGELDKLMDIYNEHYDRAKSTFDEVTLRKFDRIMELYNDHCGLLDITRVERIGTQPRVISKITPETAAKMRLQLNNNDSNNNKH